MEPFDFLAPSGASTNGGAPMGTPFDRLIGLPGIDDLSDVFAGVGNGSGGGPPMGEGGFSNPFERWDPLTDGNPFIVGDEPNLEGAPFTGGGSNPFMGGANPFGDGASFTGGGNPFGDGAAFMGGDTSFGA